MIQITRASDVHHDFARFIAKPNIGPAKNPSTTVAKNPNPTKSHTVADPRPRFMAPDTRRPRKKDVLRLTAWFRGAGSSDARHPSVAGSIPRWMSTAGEHGGDAAGKDVTQMAVDLLDAPRREAGRSARMASASIGGLQRRGGAQ